MNINSIILKETQNPQEPRATISVTDIAKAHDAPLELIEGMLEWGIITEQEHTDDPTLAENQALAHLMNDPVYYTKVDVLMEGDLATAGHIMLDIVGLGADILGGNGAWFDAANALWYAGEKNYLYAALSLISVIPIIGDVVGKGGKLIHSLEKGRRAGASIYKTGKVMKRVDTIAKIKSLKLMLKQPDIQAKIAKIFDKAEENEKFKPHIPKMKEAITDFSNDPVSTPGVEDWNTELGNIRVTV